MPEVTETTAADVRAAFSRWASGVCVVTTQAPDGSPIGLTATSFTAVSIDPPLMLWCLDNRSHSMQSFRTAETYAVHILGENQDQTSASFARAGRDKFAHRPVSDGPVPHLRHCLVRLECRHHGVIDAGDHTIFIGRIDNVSTTDGNPLLYFRARYGIYSSHPSHDPFSLETWL